MEKCLKKLLKVFPNEETREGTLGRFLKNSERGFLEMNNSWQNSLRNPLFNFWNNSEIQEELLEESSNEFGKELLMEFQKKILEGTLDSTRKKSFWDF